MNSQGTTTSTSSTQPFSPQVPYLTYGFGQAKNLYDRGAQVPDAYNQILAQAQGGNSGYDASKQYLTSIINGGYQNPGMPALKSIYDTAMQPGGSNPYLQQMGQQISDLTQGAVNSSFAGANRFGSGANADVLARQVGNNLNNLYGQQYQSDQSRALAAGQGMGTIAQQGVGAGIVAANSLPAVAFGSLPYQAQVQQSMIDAPWLNAQRYQGLVSGNYGNTSTATQPYFTNPTGQAIGALGGLASAAYLGANAYNALSGGGSAAAGSGGYFNPTYTYDPSGVSGFTNAAPSASSGGLFSGIGNWFSNLWN